MKKKTLRRIIALAVSATILCCGCGGKSSVTDEKSSSNPNAEEPAPQESEEVTISLGIFEYSANSYPKELIKQFEKEHPGVTVECQDISSKDYQDKMSTMLASGDTVDIITVSDMSYFAQWVNQERLMPLDDYIAESGYDMSIYNGIEEAVKLNGNTYCVPFLSNSYVLFYNKDVFDEAGIAYPDNDMTWEEFRELARELTSESTFGAHFNDAIDIVLAPSIANGTHGTLVDGDYDKFLPYLQQVYDMQEEGTIMDYGTLKATAGFYPGYFYNRQMAMLYMGNWFLGRLNTDMEEYDFKWGMVYPPHAEGENAGETCVNMNGFAINKNSEHPDLAWEFIQMAGGETGANIMANLGYMPAYKTDEIVEIIASTPAFPDDDNSKESLQPKKATIVMPADTAVGEIQKVLLEELELARYKEQTPEEAVENMERRVAEIRNK